MSTSTCILISTHSSTSTTSNSTSTRIIILLHLTNFSLFEAHIASVNVVVHISDPAQYDVPAIGMLHRNIKTVFVQFWHFSLISYPLKSYQCYQYEISCDPLLSDYYGLLHIGGDMTDKGDDVIYRAAQNFDFTDSFWGDLLCRTKKNCRFLWLPSIRMLDYWNAKIMLI